MKFGVIVSGLPASGKTTVARILAQGLEFAFLDKDDFLEALFDCSAVRSSDERNQLSRQSDGAFHKAALEAPSAVLVSHWRPLGAASESGTPTDWLAEAFDALIEVYCHCPTKLAHARFINRERHPGHLDRLADPQVLQDRFEAWSARYPLGVGRLVTLRTDAPFPEHGVIDEVSQAIATITRDANRC